MRVQPHLPSRPLTAMVTSRSGFGLFRMQRGEQPRAAGAEDQNVGRRVVCSVHAAADARRAPRRAAPRASALTSRVQRAAVRIHRHQQRAEALDAEFPQALGIQVVEIDVLDRLDPGRLQRRGAADDGEIGAAEIAEGGERRRPHAALADDDAHAVALHQRPREALHAHRRRGADADRLIAGRDSPGAASTLRTLGAVWMTAWPLRSKRVVRPRSNMCDQRGVADAEQRVFQRDGVADLAARAPALRLIGMSRIVSGPWSCSPQLERDAAAA